VEIRFEAWGKELRLNLERSHLLQEFRECSSDLMEMPRQVIERSGIDPKSIRRVLLIGELLGVPELRSLIAKALPANVAMEVVTQADLARGAALQAQYLMPPGDSSGPSAIPHSVYDIGLLTMSHDNPTGMPKILIPKGSRLPAEFSRTIRFSSQSTRSPALQFVESTQMDGNWHRLGAVEPGTVFPKRLPEQPLQLRLELDLSGLLHCTLTWMAGNQQVVVPNSSHADMDPASVQQWRDWLETIFLCSAPLTDSD
jgi:molecular chaperone DnaK (HSP70)